MSSQVTQFQCLIIEDQAVDKKRIYYQNMKHLGEAVRDVDGDWLFFFEGGPGNGHGGWPAYLLIALGEMLKQWNPEPPTREELGGEG